MQEIFLIWYGARSEHIFEDETVFLQVIRSTVRRYFRGRQHGPHENVYIRKTNPQKTLEITEI